jgi:hypothetical protein
LTVATGTKNLSILRQSLAAQQSALMKLRAPTMPSTYAMTSFQRTDP